VSVITKRLILTSPEGDEWAISVQHIILHRAGVYGGTDKALQETVVLFSSDDFEIEDWAVNNMNWSDVEANAVKIKECKLDMDTAWAEGEFRVE